MVQQGLTRERRLATDLALIVAAVCGGTLVAGGGFDRFTLILIGAAAAGRIQQRLRRPRTGADPTSARRTA